MVAYELSPEQVVQASSTFVVGRVVHHRVLVDSTMDVGRELAEQGTPDGTLVIAEEQAAGRGRLARRWWAPRGTCLLMTVVFRPRLEPCQAQRLTMICALAVCDAIERVCALEARIKWPNDVLIGDKKVCGILTELGLYGSALAYALVGIGINVNVDWDRNLPLMMPATSLSAETGGQVSRLDLLAALLAAVEKRYLPLQEGRSFRRAWADRLETLGRLVRVADGTDVWQGRAVGVDEDGALIIRLDDGSERRFLAGDVTLRPSPE
jgi:BirA family biotin operon repressor/biotin-[acetyl-CoA-carboxylase] ligase